MSAGVVTIYLAGRDRIAVWRCPNDARPRYRYDPAPPLLLLLLLGVRQGRGEEKPG